LKTNNNAIYAQNKGDESMLAEVFIRMGSEINETSSLKSTLDELESN